ncbi:MAG: hypothetical protein V2A73_12915 [Pseudomonadota bacterium]
MTRNGRFSWLALVLLGGLLFGCQQDKESLVLCMDDEIAKLEKIDAGTDDTEKATKEELEKDALITCLTKVLALGMNYKTPECLTACDDYVSKHGGYSASRGDACAKVCEAPPPPPPPPIDATPIDAAPVDAPPATIDATPIDAMPIDAAD